ncbi:hypothetical protein OAG36_01150 [bacterium]|nr:hypothetical protein [bacterium]
MASQLPQIRRIYTQDVIDGEGNIDPERLLYTLNLFMESTYSLLDKGLNYDVNIISQTIELEFKTPSTYIASKTFSPVQFLININKKPEGVELLQIQKKGTVNDPITEPVHLSWCQKEESICISYISGLADNTSYTLRVRVT